MNNRDTIDKLWLMIGGHATWCKANDLSSCSNESFQPVIPIRLALLVQAVQVKGASTWVPNVPTAILQVFFFCGGLVGGWLRTSCMGHWATLKMPRYTAAATVQTWCHGGWTHGRGVTWGPTDQGFNGFSVSYRNLPPYFSVNLGALGHPLLSLFSVKYGFVWKCWVNIPNEIAIFHRDNDQQNHWV